jgi:hypothetical protein
MQHLIGIQVRTLSGSLQYRGTTVLTYAVHYPLIDAPRFPESARAINAFYRNQAHHIVRGIITRQYHEAAAEYRNSIENGYPFREFAIERSVVPTYASDCVASMYFDFYEFTGGAHGTTARTSDTWDVSRARRLPLGDMFPGNPDYKEDLIAAIQRQIAEQSDMYFEDAENMARESFDEDSFYLTPDALVIYYQQYDIAPYAFGIPEFRFPCGELGAQRPRCRPYRRKRG